MKLRIILMTLMPAFAWVFAAQAGTTTFKGQTIRFTGTVSVTGEDSTYRLFTFTSGTGTIILPSDVKADILAVGGGGGGGGGRRSGSKTYTYTGGSGGGGGGVDERKGVSLSAQTLSISVGDGGAGGSYSTSSNQAGSQGGESKVYNGLTNYAKADGGAGGAGGNASNDGQGASGQTGTDKRNGKSSDVSGTLMTYGVGGQKTNNSNTTRSARTANTGNGGNGATKPGGSNSQHYVGQGGDSGVVIVKITDIAEPKPVASLISGTIPVGAYDVEILNASRTNWVDGELVVTFLNTDTAVGKSFTLPKQTTGQLLAVGGGGAGGQDSSYSKDFGLPGGGGAGGLVFSGDQAFAAAKYRVTVGAGGVAPRGTMNKHAGANGEDSTVTCAGETFANALGGGGGGVQTVVGQAGGCGGGGSYSGTAAGSSIQESDAKMGVGFPGGAGNNAKFGGGGGGAGGAGKPTSTADSGAGGPGLELGITGANVVYAHGGDGGVPRVYAYQYYDEKAGKKVLTNTSPDKNGKIDGYRAYYVEASDGKPGLEGRGNGGGGGGHYSSSATYAGSGGSGVVIVRISPYPTTVEDALKTAFTGQPVTVSGSQVTLTGDVSGPIGLPDNIGAVTIDLAGHAIAGADGAAGEPVDITPGGDGEPAIRLVPHVYTCEAGRTQVKICGSGGLVGGNGGTGYPGGRGSTAVARAAGVDTDVTVDTGTASQTSGADGETYVQHAHVWTYKQVGNEIHATCVATDGEQCSYKKPEHALKIVLHADDVEFTGARYDSAGVDNGILPVVGIPTGIVFYEGREDKGTVYPKSATPPTDAGYYLATLTFNGMTMEKDFSIIEGKMQQDTVYQSAKTAVRSGSDVLITLRASYDGAKAINYGNVLFLGSRCSAHSMKTAALAGTINALTPFANVQWYAYGSTDPTENKSGYTAKGQQVQESEFTLVGKNHFVYDRMMDDLYAELVENRNNRAYDMVILEFDGDLLGRNHLSPYQLTYTLPDGWTDEKAAILRTAMSAFYDANRVVWVVPNVDVTKEDSGYTGAYPWTSKPEFVWQRALLNATEDAGYCCPLQKNYEDADELISFMQQALIGAYFKKVKITDKIADGLSFSTDDVATEFRDVDGLWKNACPSAVESRYGTTITATKTVNGRTVAVEFDTSAFQAEALRREALVNNDVRVTIRARIEDEFFSGLGGGAPKDTNVGDATFVYSGGEDVGDFTNNVPPASIPNVKPDPIYEAKDYVGYYDAEGHTITVTVIDPDPAVKTPDIRYSLEKDGSYDKDLLLTNVCEAVNVWFTLTAEGYATVTNYAKVTIRPRVVELTAEDATKAYDGDPLTTNGFTVASVTPDDYDQGKGFVLGEGIDKVTMTDDSQQTEVGNHSNVVNPDKSTMIPKTGTDLDNYIVITHPGTLTVTSPLSMGIEAFDAEKFYDAEPTNITYVVTNAAGVAITDAIISLREKGADSWIPAADFTLYVDTTNVIVEVRAEKSGFDPVEAEATVLVKPRPVTLIAASDSKTYDGLPLTNWNFTVKTDTTTPGYGFVKEEGVASVTMTPDSTITDPGSQPNVIASETAKPNTKLERNYILSTVDGTLTVTAATMGIAAFPAEKFYDAEPTNITYVVTNAAGVAITDATISLREKGTDNWIPVADFTPYVDTTNVIVEVRAEKSGFDPVEAEATVLVKPRPVTLIAASDSKTYDGLPLTNWNFTVKTDTTTEGYGFVNGEGVASVTMTPESTVTLPDTQPNVIATEVAKEGTKLERNYIVTTEPGTLTVTPAAFTASAMPYDEFYDGQEHTIEVDIQKPEEAGEATVTYSYEEGGTYLPIEDFEQLKDVTAGGPVTVYAKVKIEGYSTVVVSSTVNIKPRIVAEQAEDASKTYDGTPLVQPNHFENADVEAEKSKEKWSTTEVPANSIGFVAGEGFASVPMTAVSTITEPGMEDNVIDAEAVTLLEGTKPGNYIFFYLPGELTVIQRQEEVRRDPEVEIPEESKEAVKESDQKIEKTLDEMAKADQEATGEPYVKYQLTVTPTNHLNETTRTTPEKAAEDAKEQIELAESETGSKIDKVEFVDIVLERTYSKEEAEATAAGDYNKDNWEPLDKAEEHGNQLLVVTIPVKVPEGMELAGVTRSCDNKGTEILKPKDPKDPKDSNAEGFVYDPETKTVALYAYDFCIFGFMMKEKAAPPPPPPPPTPPTPPDVPVVVKGGQVGDYRAQVAYVDMQKVTGTVNGRAVSVLLKYVKTCTIKGYVVYSDCACDSGDGRVNPAYLVVKSTVQKKINTPRIFPAELLVKMWDRSGGTAGTVEAEGYLFAGFGKGAYTFDEDFASGDKQANTLFLDNTRGYAVRPWANNSAIYGDDGADPIAYWWDERDAYKFGSVDTVSTRFLFGTYNDLTRNADGTTNFYDSWMDHAGFGKAAAFFEDQGCAEADHGTCLKTLQGYLIGGLYICYQNGYSMGRWEWFPCHEWYGTTEVVTGLWGMRKFTNPCPETALTAADGSFLTGIHFNPANARFTKRGTAPAEGAYLVNQQKAKPLFGYLKSCVIALGGASNLGFIDAEDTSLTTSLLLQDGSRDIWYNVNTTETDTDASTYSGHLGEGVVAGENTPWEHFFSCSCGKEAAE